MAETAIACASGFARALTQRALKIPDFPADRRQSMMDGWSGRPAIRIRSPEGQGRKDIPGPGKSRELQTLPAPNSMAFKREPVHIRETQWNTKTNS